MRAPWIGRGWRKDANVASGVDEDVHDIRDANYYFRPWERSLNELEEHCLLSRQEERSDAGSSRRNSTRPSRRIDGTKSFIGPVEFEVLKDFYGVNTVEEMERVILGWKPQSSPTATSIHDTPMQQQGAEGEMDLPSQFRFPKPRFKAGMTWIRKKLTALGKRIVAFLRRIFRKTRRQVRVDSEEHFDFGSGDISAAVDAVHDRLSQCSESDYAVQMKEEIDLEELLNEASQNIR